MASKVTKQRPAGVPEENIYDKMHWTLIVAFVATAVTLYFIVTAG